MAKVLVVAPHADDEVLGLGGTIAKLSAEGHDLTVAVLTGHGVQPHPLLPKKTWSLIRAEALEAHEILGVKKTIFRELPAVLVPDQPVYKVNKVVFDIIEKVQPDVLYIPFLFDLHRDHREICYACTVASRPNTATGRRIREIAMYETVSETHWNIHQQEGGFLPNIFVDISGVFLERKLAALACFKSQMRPFPDARSIEAVEALARFRGSIVCAPAAESFVLVRKLA